jgi:hypothetical protein
MVCAHHPANDIVDGERKDVFPSNVVAQACDAADICLSKLGLLFGK